MLLARRAALQLIQTYETLLKVEAEKTSFGIDVSVGGGCLQYDKYGDTWMGRGEVIEELYIVQRVRSSRTNKPILLRPIPRSEYHMRDGGQSPEALISFTGRQISSDEGLLKVPIKLDGFLDIVLITLIGINIVP